jgi:type I restriction enzyme S subunit
MTDRSTWPRVKFGDVVKLNTDRSADPLADGLERYVGLEHIEPEDLRIRRWGLVAEGTTFTNRFRPGQVLFGKRRAYQRKVAVADFEGVCSSDIYVFEPKDDRLLPELLPFLCQTEGFFEHAVGTSAGSLSPRTNWTQLANYEFALPPLEEQRTIVETLIASQKTVDAFSIAYDASQTNLASIREHLFAQHSTQEHSLADLVTFIEAGKSLSGTNFPPDEHRFGVLKVSAVGRDGFLPSESKQLIEQNSFVAAYQVKKGDLLITRANTPELVGMTCLVDQDYPYLMLSDKTLRLVLRDEYESGLIFEALNTVSIRQQIMALATGTGAAMKNISQEKLNNLIVRLPFDSQGNSEVIQQMRIARNAVSTLNQRMNYTKVFHQTLVNTLL